MGPFSVTLTGKQVRITGMNIPKMVALMPFYSCTGAFNVRLLMHKSPKIIHEPIGSKTGNNIMENNEFLGLRTVVYNVDDLKKAKKWYQKILGKSPYFDKPFYVGFEIGGYELGLQPQEGQKEESSQTTVAYWGVHDIQHTYRRLLELGATAYEQPQNVGDDIMIAAVEDPWDNVFGIIYNPSFKEKS